MGKVTQTKKGKPVEVRRVKCPVCSHSQDVKLGANVGCERCGALLPTPTV